MTDFLTKLEELIIDAKKHADSYYLEKHLVSNADEIAELVKAAKAIHKEHACKCLCDSCVWFSNALAALNKEKS